MCIPFPMWICYQEAIPCGYTKNLHMVNEGLYLYHKIDGDTDANSPIRLGHPVNA